MDYVGMHLWGKQHASASACSFFAVLCCATIFSTGTFFASVALQGAKTSGDSRCAEPLVSSIGRTALLSLSHTLPSTFHKSGVTPHSSRLFYCIHRQSFYPITATGSHVNARVCSETPQWTRDGGSSWYSL